MKLLLVAAVALLVVSQVAGASVKSKSSSSSSSSSSSEESHEKTTILKTAEMTNDIQQFSEPNIPTPNVELEDEALDKETLAEQLKPIE